MYRTSIAMSNKPAQVLDVASKINEKTYREASMFVTRTLTTSLTSAEFMLLHVILSHTLALGRDRFTISIYALARGRISREIGIVSQTMLPYSPPTIRKALYGLEKEHYITVERSKDDRGGFAPNTIILNRDVLRSRIANASHRTGTPYILDIEEAPDAPYSEAELL